MARLFEHSNCPNPVQWGSSPVKTAYIRETDPETNKTKWLPVGWICTGCGVFRSKSGWFPTGKADPLCESRKPAREPALFTASTPAEESPVREEIIYPAEEMVLNKTYRFHHRLKGWADDITAETPEIALSYLEWDPADVDIRKVWKSSGKPGEAGHVTAGWGKLDLETPAREVEDSAHDDDDKARQTRRTGPRQFRIYPRMVAELLQISIEEVQEKLRSGEIPGWKDASRHWRVDLRWYLKQLRALGRSPAREGVRSRK
ncbi:hypothetical protein LCGC14_1900400 [marine sediment metagenome]|uniref:Helix-turn-helix domain-containing protein n=1 Tax=marine sediment metagenome TaxID=412755 RepID=A0A0F9GK57_9ZZZZ